MRDLIILKKAILIISIRHYFYTLRGEYIIAMTPRSGGWFRPNRHATGEEFASRTHPPGGTRNLTPGRKNRKRLLLSQSMVVDIDPNKVRIYTGSHEKHR